MRHILRICKSYGISFNCCESVPKHHNSARQNFAKRANALILRRDVRFFMCEDTNTSRLAWRNKE